MDMHVVIMISKCPGWCMYNSINMKSNILVYSFPIDIDFKTTHVDIYMARKQQYVYDSKAFLILADCMAFFIVIDPLTILNTEYYANTLIKILLPCCNNIFINVFA